MCPGRDVAHLRTGGKIPYVTDTDHLTKHRTLLAIPKNKKEKSPFRRLAEDEDSFTSAADRRFESQHSVRVRWRARRPSLYHLHQSPLESSRIKLVAQSRTGATHTKETTKDIIEETVRGGKNRVGDAELLEEKSVSERKSTNIMAVEQNSVEKMRRNVMQSLSVEEVNETVG